MTGPVRILIVDDTSSMRRVLKSILDAAGCEVVAAEGVRTALRCLRTFRPDVILTDFNMPTLNGEAFVRLVRRHPRLSDVPVLVVSSEEGRALHRRMEEAGATAWLGKPVEPAVLIRAVFMAGRAGRAMAVPSRAPGAGAPPTPALAATLGNFT